jgi:hypothetical protein
VDLASQFKKLRYLSCMSAALAGDDDASLVSIAPVNQDGRFLSKGL